MPETEPLRGRDIPVIIVAGLLSAMLGGVLAMVLTLTFLGGVQAFLLGVYAIMLVGGEVIGGSLMIAGLPAMLLGALLLKAGETRRWARRWFAWAGAGALAGGASFGVCAAIDLFGMSELFDPSGTEAPVVAIAFGLAGALSALFFRGTFRLGRALLPEPA